MFKVLDLYCCGGGASMGMHQALERARIEHTITGIDIEVRDRYPFNRLTRDITTFSRLDLEEYDFIWASPPCQKYSALSYCTKREYPDLIPFTRALLEQSGKPYVIENVPLAPLKKDLMLCGGMFGLEIQRHRIFEMNFKVPQLEHKKHEGKFYTIAGNGGKAKITDWQRALDINWIRDKHQLAEAIPPAYSCYIMEEYIKENEK